MDITEKYFAGGNTFSGFVSYYDKIFSNLERLYIIKGGSGTGKSYFMKIVAEKAENLSKRVEYFYCSFDSDSLDGIIIDGRIGILDGTFPHVVEGRIIGAVDNLIDFGAFIDENIANRKSEIEKLICFKKDCFNTLYSYLKSMGQIERIKENIGKKYIKKDNITDFLHKYDFGVNKIFSDNILRPVSSFGKNGIVKFETYKELSTKIVPIPNFALEGYLMMENIKNECETRNIGIKISPSIFDDKKINSILTDSGICFEISNYDLQNEFDNFNVQNFISFDDKSEIISLTKMQEKLISSSEKLLKQAAEIHFEIEKIYEKYMDFNLKEEFTIKFLSKIENYF